MRAVVFEDPAGIQMFGVVAVLGVPETFEKLAQQAAVDEHLTDAEQPIVRSAMVVTRLRFYFKVDVIVVSTSSSAKNLLFLSSDDAKTV